MLQKVMWTAFSGTFAKALESELAVENPKVMMKAAQKRPDESMWKRILDTAFAVLILLGIAFLLPWAAGVLWSSFPCTGKPV